MLMDYLFVGNFTKADYLPETDEAGIIIHFISKISRANRKKTTNPEKILRRWTFLL